MILLEDEGEIVWLDPYKIEQQIDVKLARAKELAKLGPKVRWLQVRVIK